MLGRCARRSRRWCRCSGGSGRTRLWLHAESGSRLGGGYLVGQEFQGNETIEFYILGLIDDAHSTTAELLDDAVVRDGLTEHRRNAMAYGFGSQRWWTVGSPN